MSLLVFFVPADAVVTPVAPVTEKTSGGWGAYNEADAARQRRRRRELEEEADRLEALLAEEGLIQPDPVAIARYTVTEYAPYAADFSRRAQRAIEYAKRAETAHAYELAAKQIAQQIEEEDMAVMMVLASFD